MINKNFYRKFLIPFLFMTLIFFTINFQTTLWFGFFGHWTSPVLWPTVFVYLNTQRFDNIRSLWIIFFFFVLSANSTAISFFILPSLIFLSYLIRFIQKRFSAIDTSDLIPFSLFSTFIFPLLYAGLSSLAQPFVFDLWSHMISLALTFPLVPALLFICRKIDRLLNFEDEGILLAKI